jgi:hypothetical protein
MEVMKRAAFRIRHHEFEHFYLAFFLAGLMIVFLLGILPYASYLNAPTYTFKPSFSGFDIAHNNTIVPDGFGVTVYVDPPQLFFSYAFTINSAGTYYFIFIFPFYVKSPIEMSQEMNITSTSRGTVILVRYQMGSINGGASGTLSDIIFGYFSIDQTFMSGSRGSYVFTLPFGTGASPDVRLSAIDELEVNFHREENVTLAIALPRSYVPTSIFPPSSQRPPHGSYYSDNRTFSHLEWDSTVPQNDVTVICENQDEMASYSNRLFYSGVFLGIGSSLTLTAVYDGLKERHEKAEKDFE